jgi:hypothetical protein
VYVPLEIKKQEGDPNSSSSSNLNAGGRIPQGVAVTKVGGSNISSKGGGGKLFALNRKSRNMSSSNLLVDMSDLKVSELFFDFPVTKVHFAKRVKAMFTLFLKDGFSTVLSFPDEEAAKIAIDVVASRAMPDHCIKVFAFLHRPPHYTAPNVFDLEREYNRLGFPTASFIVDTSLNANYKFCPTYPKALVLPRLADPELLQDVADFRSRRRIPVGTFLYKESGAVLFRSSQPLVAMSHRSKEDECFMSLLCNDGQKRLIILDSRPKTNAQANR